MLGNGAQARKRDVIGHEQHSFVHGLCKQLVLGYDHLRWVKIKDRISVRVLDIFGVTDKIANNEQGQWGT
jgi:hypothetical protein